jgi:protein MpaA
VVGLLVSGLGCGQALAARGDRTIVARSVDGRVIRAVELGRPGARLPVLIVGCIHGDECAGEAVIAALAARPGRPPADLWVVASLNPDGAARGTRGNARGVDLNRNLPFRWRPGTPGTGEYPGPRPLSEPESRFAYRLIRTLRPRITIWFHQSLALVDESGGNVRIERRFARLVGLPLRRLARYNGSVATWQNHAYPASTAFVVELPAGQLTRAAARRYAAAIMALVA